MTASTPDYAKSSALNPPAGLPDVILDGEILVLGDDSDPDFAALRARLESA
jgi:ATP-dependent DNA ligase